MKRWAAPLVLARHAFRVWRGGQARFRLETFGLYYPALPYTTRWWRIKPSALALLLRQAGEYGAWILEMEDLKANGSSAWWERRGWKGHAAHDVE